MKGGSWNLPTSMPLSTPTSKQATSVIRMAGMGCMPPDISVPEIMALMPTTEPMDRSMLPVMSR